MQHYDVIVIGLGAMGSAATYQLAKSGAKVLGIDQYSPPHHFGSSHGDTRITRLAIGEGAEYVPLVQRSHEIWRDLESELGVELLKQSGGLIMSVKGSQGQHGVSDFVEQTTQSAERYGIDHENLNTEQIHSRFPQFNLSSEHGYYEGESGYLLPEQCIKAQLDQAFNYGAELKTNERVLSWEDAGNEVTVLSELGTYTTNKLIVTTGPWMNDLVTGYESLFKVYRQTLYWFEIQDKYRYQALRDMPIYVWVYGIGKNDMIYGFPAVDGPDGGIKLAAESYEITTSPQDVVREVSQHEIDRMYEQHVRNKFPGVSGKCVRVKTCLYTVTPDFKFIIDFHPDHENVIVASPCSGHGFKHSAAIGEVLAQMATTGQADIDISSFSFARFK